MKKYISFLLLFFTYFLIADNSIKTAISSDAVVDWSKGKVYISVKEKLSKVAVDSRDPDYGKESVAFNITEARNKAFIRARENIKLKSVRAIETLVLNDRSTILDRINSDPIFRERFNQFYLLPPESLNVRYIEDSLSIDSSIALLGKDGVMNYITMGFGDESFPEFKDTNLPVEYTGLILDARHLKALPSLLPRIVTSEGLEIYSYHLVNKNYAIDKGMASYQKNPLQAMSDKRVGEKPYFLVAQSTTGPNQSSFVVPTEDAIKLLSHPKTKLHLKMCRVIILLPE